MVKIDARFNGPPGSAHGGVACGVFASLVDSRSAVVRLVAPPPLDAELVVEIRDGASVVSGRQGPVAQVRPLTGELPVEPVSWLDNEEIGAARQRWIDAVWPVHVFPSCFGCGHLRPLQDGLELYAGPVPDKDLAAASWTPDRSLGPSGPVADWAVWAAVDCPSGAVVWNERPEASAILLGELKVQIAQTPLVGSDYQVIARSRGREGRRLHSDVSLIDAEGLRLAVAQATWIAVDVPTEAGRSHE